MRWSIFENFDHFVDEYSFIVTIYLISTKYINKTIVILVVFEMTFNISQ